MTRVFLTISLWTLAACTGAQTDLESAFDSANQAYANGDFATAIAGYESILENRLHFGTEYNLGNAYYKNEDWGPAILHYERALRLSPNDPDVKTNLVLANAQIKDRIEPLPSNGILDVWERIVAPGRFRLWAGCMLVTWTLGFLALAWRIWETRIENRRILGSSAATLVAAGVLSMVMVWSTAQRIESSKAAIIMAVETPVRNQPGASGLTLFMLHEGTKVTVIQRNADHWKVQLANGNVGWLSASDVEEI